MKKIMLELLKKEVKPAMGCTEPVAVVLAAAKAREAGKHVNIEKVEVIVSPNFYKNGLSVGIPHSPEVGLDIAGAIGAFGGNSAEGLKIMESVDAQAVEKATAFTRVNGVSLGIKETDAKVYVEVRITSENGKTKAVIEQMHHLIVLIEHDDEVLYQMPPVHNNEKEVGSAFFEMSLKSIISEIEKMSFSDLEFLMEGLEMNEAIAMAGIREKKGMGVGYTINKNIENGTLADDLPNRAMCLTAAASDARMSGMTLPVMSSNGSGNNGLTAILPLVAYRKTHMVSDERMAQALAISHLLNCYIKKHIGRLSALCSCAVSAGTASGAAITWLEGGNLKAISGTIQNMIGNLSGMLCDGAKTGCALKLATAASSGVHASILAMNDVRISQREGIVGRSVEESIRNLGIVGARGMQLTDQVILEVMKNMEAEI